MAWPSAAQDLSGATGTTAEAPSTLVHSTANSVEALERFVWQTVHKHFYGHRHQWFERMDERYFVMWWVPAGYQPTVQEAIERLRHFQQRGPSDHAFGWESVPSAKLWKAARCA
jgi:hypothetical protein